MNRFKLISSIFAVAAIAFIFGPPQRALSQSLAELEGPSIAEDPILTAQAPPTPNPTPEPSVTPKPVAPPTATPDPSCQTKCEKNCKTVKKLSKGAVAVLSPFAGGKNNLGGGKTDKDIEDAYILCIAGCALKCLPK